MNDLRNKVQLIGHLGREVDFKQLENGKSIARVSLATKEVRKNQAGEKEINTQWHNIIAWGKQAERMQVYFKKGKQVAVQGKLAHRSYEDQDGIKRQVSEVVLKEFMLIN